MQFKGVAVIPGQYEGGAIVTAQPINITAAFTKGLVFPWLKGKVADKEHDLCGQDLRGKVLFLPTFIGSTTGGLILLEVFKAQIAPRAIVVQTAESLLVSGAILARLWLEGVPLPPIIECPAAFAAAKTGNRVRIAGDLVDIEPQSPAPGNLMKTSTGSSG